MLRLANHAVVRTKRAVERRPQRAIVMVQLRQTNLYEQKHPSNGRGFVFRARPVRDTGSGRSQVHFERSLS
jgi:hypothetical protein